MKKSALHLAILLLAAGILHAQNDTMYIMNSGRIISKYHTTDIDSIIFYKPVDKGMIIRDYDGNTYQTVRIGDQTWMAENLRTNHYADGTPVPLIEGEQNWNALSNTDKAYCWYDNDSIKNAGIYGALYTWAAAMNGVGSTDTDPSGVQGICPDGWHLPSAQEWASLVSYLIQNGYNYDGSTQGNKLGKSLAATTYWLPSALEGSIGNTDYPVKRNQTGFSAVPAGYRDSFGKFNYIGSETYFWSSTEVSQASSQTRSLAFYARDFLDTPPYCFSKKNAFSVRCIKD